MKISKKNTIILPSYFCLICLVMSDSEDSLNASVSSGDAALQDQNFLTKSQSNSIAFEPCVRGATISQERECLRKIREMALDITPESRVSDEMSVYEFAFQYVLTDRTRRKHNIKRAKDRARARQESNSEPQ